MQHTRMPPTTSMPSQEAEPSPRHDGTLAITDPANIHIIESLSSELSPGDAEALPRRLPDLGAVVTELNAVLAVLKSSHTCPSGPGIRGAAKDNDTSKSRTVSHGSHRSFSLPRQRP